MLRGQLAGLARRAAAQATQREATIHLQQQRAFGVGGPAAAASAASAGAARQPWLLAVAAGLSAGLGLQLYSAGSGEPAACKAQDGGAAASTAGGAAAAAKADALPEYSREEVARHRTKEASIWDGVYDVTEWADLHPGGSQRLMLAAGSAIDPFWAMYQQHNTAQARGRASRGRRPAAPPGLPASCLARIAPSLVGSQVREILEGYRIGRLKGGAPVRVEDPYASEPTDRSPALIVRSAKPMNSETPRELLAASLVTPNALFYIRNHLPTPDVDAAAYRLTVEGEGLRTVKLSLEDLKTMFRKHTITATLQCTGNRRAELNPTKKVKGLEWEGGSISTAVWGGARLRDVLKFAGLSEDDPEVQHIQSRQQGKGRGRRADAPAPSLAGAPQFEGLDKDLEQACYGASIPVTKALDPHGDVLLAYEMNGEALPRDHGFPVRVIVPGVAGCRSVKWVGKVVASQEESHSFWQRSDYKSFSPSVDWDNVDWDSAPAIQNMPVTSLICEPGEGAAVAAGDEVTVKGYAWSGGGQGIIRVDVSADGGKTWHTAALNKAPQRPGRGWAWALWEAEVPVPKDAAPGQQVEIICKATDESYNTQPENPGPIWNLRGVNCNSWHRVRLTVE
eukprot:scaffold7.g3634.t1